MDYIDAWQLMRRKSEELKNRQIILYSLNNKYGFKLNINHPYIHRKFLDFQRAKNIGRYGMTDALRHEFEEQMMKSNYFKKLVKAEEKKYGPAYEYIKKHGCYPKEWQDTNDEH